MSKSNVRVRLLQLVMVVGFVLLVARAGQIQILRGSHYRQQVASDRMERVELPAPRGTIYDRYGQELALTRPIYRVDLTYREFENLSDDLPTVAGALGVPIGHVRQQGRQQYRYLHGPFFHDQVEPIRGMSGVHLREESQRLHPNPSLARALLGRPELDSVRVATGLERVLDSLLAGVPGQAVVINDQLGSRQVQSPSRLDAFPEPGHDVYLTIDVGLQDIVERTLDEAIERYEADAADILVMDPRTGELLALASRRASGGAPPDVFTHAFEPGSTAKIFAAAGLLVHDLVQPEDSVWGENGEWAIGRRVIHDHEPEDWMRLPDVIRRSSNIGIAKLAARMDREQQYRILRDFGFGYPTTVDFPVESAGRLRHPRDWSGTSNASLAIGYEFAVTMLQLAQAYAAVANDGILLRPQLIREVRKGDRVVFRSTSEPVRQVVSPEIAAQLRSMLKGVVLEGGTGETAALTSFEIGGKTGTARRASPSGYIPGSYRASFAAMLPVDDPQLVVIVKLDDPKDYYARQSAAPLTRAVLAGMLSARSPFLDFARTNVTSDAPDPEPAVGRGSTPYVVRLPLQAARHRPDSSVVPDLIGRTFREAARQLHALGLRVAIEGSGSVTAVDPAPGSRVGSGEVITLIGRDVASSP